MMALFAIYQSASFVWNDIFWAPEEENLLQDWGKQKPDHTSRPVEIPKQVWWPTFKNAAGKPWPLLFFSLNSLYLGDYLYSPCPL